MFCLTHQKLFSYNKIDVFFIGNVDVKYSIYITLNTNWVYHFE